MILRTPRSGGAGSTRILRAAVTGLGTLLLAGLLGACSGGDPGSGPLLLAVDGRAVVDTPDGERVVVDGRRRVEVGSQVEMVRGSATLEYPGGTTYELREGTTQGDDTALVAASRPRLDGGDLLVVDGRGVEVEVDGAVVRVDGTGKVGRRLAVMTQMYQGSGEVTSAGRSVAVPALRQAAVPGARLVPAAPSPLAYDPNDSWDRRYLGDAVALGEARVSRARGFTAQLRPGEGTTPGFFRLLLPDLEVQPGFDGSLVDRSRPAGETLVGAAIVTAASAEADADRFRQSWQQAFAFRSEGADWGLVALDQGVARDVLVDRLDAAIARAPLSQVAGGPSLGDGVSAPAPSPSLSPPPDGGRRTPPPPPGPGPTPPPPDDGNLVEDLIGQLLQPITGTTSEPTLDGLLQPVGDEALLP